jgi:hypothetical protein
MSKSVVRLSRVGALLFVALVVVVPASSPAGASPSGKVRAYPFAQGWLPATFVTSPTRVVGGIQSSSGGGSQSGAHVVHLTENVMYGGRTKAEGELFLQAASSKLYQKGYWANYFNSHGYRHASTSTRTVIYARISPSSVLALTKLKGYIVTVMGVGVTNNVVVRFCKQLKYVAIG